MPKFTQPLITGISQGVKPWLSAEQYPILVDGHPRDEDLDRDPALGNGCLCRRCYLHDDFGGCVRAS